MTYISHYAHKHQPIWCLNCSLNETHKCTDFNHLIEEDFSHTMDYISHNVHSYNHNFIDFNISNNNFCSELYVNLNNYSIITPDLSDSLSFVSLPNDILDTWSNLTNHCYHNNNALINVPLEGPVINLSSFQLTPDMTTLLSKGLNFCPMPGEPDRYELRRDLDKFHVSLRRKLFFDKCPGPTNTLDTTDTTLLQNTSSEDLDAPFSDNKFKNPSTWCPPGTQNLESMIMINEMQLNTTSLHAPGHHNLTRGEQTALAELQRANSVVIKPADKGSAVVIQNREDYIQEGLRQLSDTNFYIEVNSDLTQQHNIEIHNFVHHMQETGDINLKCMQYLCTPRPRTPQLYLLPKIHKNKFPVPGRPIVSANNSPTERISQLADYFLQPLVKSTKSYVRDTTDFVNKIEQLTTVSDNAILCTIDVSSLYTNIPNQEGITACSKQLEHNRRGQLRPSNNHIIHLLELVLSKNNFDFNGKHYLQTGGTAMGTKVAPSFANLFMADFEDTWVYNQPIQPRTWLRYIDDILIVWEAGEDKLSEFLTHLNTCHNTIKFTSEQSTSSVNFLDTTVKIGQDRKLYTTLYTKPTDSHNYLLYDSAHPMHTKRSLPYSQFLRLRRICSHLEDFDSNALMIASHFRRRQYPLDLIEDSLIKARRVDRTQLLNPPTSQETTNEMDNFFLITTFTPGTQPATKVVEDNWHILGRTNTTTPIHNRRIIFGNRRNKNLRDTLVHAKLPKDPAKAPANTGTHPPMHICKTRTCRYCPRIDTSGTITSHATKRTHITRKLVTCKSNNVIYCISCNTCHLQYVGQTKNRIIDRFGKHFYNITLPNLDDPIGRHFAKPNHHQLDDVTIHILEFITPPSNSKAAKGSRDFAERKWIHRLMTISPQGLNLAE